MRLAGVPPDHEVVEQADATAGVVVDARADEARDREQLAPAARRRRRWAERRLIRCSVGRSACELMAEASQATSVGSIRSPRDRLRDLRKNSEHRRMSRTAGRGTIVRRRSRGGRDVERADPDLLRRLGERAPRDRRGRRPAGPKARRRPRPRPAVDPGRERRGDLPGRPPGRLRGPERGRRSHACRRRSRARRACRVPRDRTKRDLGADVAGHLRRRRGDRRPGHRDRLTRADPRTRAPRGKRLARRRPPCRPPGAGCAASARRGASDRR